MVPHHRPTRTASCRAFARSALQRLSASHLALLIAASGGSLSFHRQLLRLPNGFRFHRIGSRNDLSSFSCVGHIYWSLVSLMQDVQFPVLRRTVTLTCPGLTAPPPLGDSGWHGSSTTLAGSAYSHFSKVSICLLMDATRSSISSAPASRFGELALSFRAWCSN